MNAFETSLNEVLVETFNYILKYEEQSLRQVMEVPITIGEAHMIEAVGRQEGRQTTVSALAGALNITMPTATVAVKKLENKGFLKKVPCDTDGRRAIISLTDRGRRVEKLHQLFHEKMVRSISSQMAPTEQEVLLQALTSLSAFFKKKAEPET